MWPDVSVIIPYYDNPAGLRAVLAALRAQDYPARVEIIVADDGSPTPPEQEPSLVDALTDVITVRQDDLGFRAAAARNLGASAATGEVYAFLDGDTIPQPGYLTAAVAHVQRNRRAVVVGTRLTGPDLAEPSWLTKAWAATADLARADSTSWRFIISAVLTCSANFFHHIGGFDPGFVGYGGEDWEFGWRAWNAGAEFVHEPGALAHHPEADFGARHCDEAEEVRVKNAETLALAGRITHPIARPAGVVFDTADVAVVVPDCGGPGALEVVISSWLRIDARVYTPVQPALFRNDPRVRTGRPAGERLRVTLASPWALADAEAFYRRATDRFFVLPDGTEVASARALSLTSPRTRTSGAWLGLSPVEGPQRLERIFAGW
ncbi:glycosyltransferase family 2 protein [Corynebacterium sanguinis]|uniref:glycosyltransferase family 2 protein n=1 Tax=Corynebacterium sanguinis TaxID=2594913 RepID=UPI0021A47F24|nr:glycosyltransferase [Corynebacterium sanguinis]MCT1411360.1 glycosyltransferase [Corynebacterium sanguinis]MCT1464133.1 glycosyltransferase [Corynebacterium sanguinis]MCT2329750.1 glycosyltransferase [Corynebacterium sanguinis]